LFEIVLSSAVGEPQVSAQSSWSWSRVLNLGSDEQPRRATREGTMDNEMGESADQPTRPDTGSALDHATRELYRLLWDLQLEGDALASAVKAADLLDIEIAATDLVCVFRAARRAHKVIEDRLADARAQEHRGRAMLHKHRRVLDELFLRAMEQTAGTATQDLLRKLLAELSAIDDEAAHGEGAAPPTSIGLSPETERAT
jgi:hypothetical protein